MLSASLRAQAAVPLAKTPLSVQLKGSPGYILSMPLKGGVFRLSDSGRSDVDKRKGEIMLRVIHGYTGTITVQAPNGLKLAELHVVDYGGPRSHLSLKGSPTHVLRPAHGGIRVEPRSGPGKVRPAKGTLKMDFVAHAGFDLHFPLAGGKVHVAKDNVKGDSSVHRGFLETPVNLGYCGDVKVLSNGRQAATLVIRNFGKAGEVVRLVPMPGFKAGKSNDGALRLERKPAVDMQVLSASTAKSWVSDVERDIRTLRLAKGLMENATDVDGLRTAVRSMIDCASGVIKTLQDANGEMMKLRPALSADVESNLTKDLGTAAEDITSLTSTMGDVFRAKKRLLVDHAKQERVQAILDLTNMAAGGLGALATAGALVAGFFYGLKNFIPMVNKDQAELRQLAARRDTLSAAEAERFEELQQVDVAWAKAGVYGGAVAGGMGTGAAVFGPVSKYIGQPSDEQVASTLESPSQVKERLKRLLSERDEQDVLKTATAVMDASVKGSNDIRRTLVEIWPSETYRDGQWGLPQAQGNWGAGSVGVIASQNVDLTATHADAAKSMQRLLSWMLAKNDHGGKWWGRSGNFTPAEVAFGKVLGRHLHSMEKPNSNDPYYWRLSLLGALTTLHEQRDAKEFKSEEGQAAFGRFEAMLQQLAGQQEWAYLQRDPDNKIDGGRNAHPDDEGKLNAPTTRLYVFGLGL